MVEHLLAAQRAHPAADTTAPEREIDQRVHRPYLPAPRLWQAGGLTRDEIKLVEEASK